MLPCPGVTGHVFAIALPADQLTLKVPSVFLSRPWVKQPTVHPTRCKLLSRYALSCYALMYLQTPASTEKHTHCRSPFTTSSSLSAAAMVYPHLRQLILPWSTKSSPSTHRLATAPVLIVTSAILPPIRTPSMTIPITLPVSLSRHLRPSPQRCPILQTTNWAKAAADSGLDLLADLPAPNADPLETVSGRPPPRHRSSWSSSVISPLPTPL